MVSRGSRRGILVCSPGGRRIDDQHRATARAVGHRALVDGCRSITAPCVRWDAQQMEKVGLVESIDPCLAIGVAFQRSIDESFALGGLHVGYRVGDIGLS